MKIIKDGNITINNIIYKFKIFDTDILIDIIRHDKKLAEMLENNIRIYRNQQFKIFNLVKEYITYRPDSQLVYFIIYNNKEIISLCRFYYYLNEKYGYFNMVYTSEKYRNKKICQNMLAYIIKITKINHRASEAIPSFTSCLSLKNFPLLSLVEFAILLLELKFKSSSLL